MLISTKVATSYSWSSPGPAIWITKTSAVEALIVQITGPGADRRNDPMAAMLLNTMFAAAVRSNTTASVVVNTSPRLHK
ncbi:hypothetical protein [Nocardia sp. NPDC052112]|uniref:hypothetical protein n=1 Tax=Nocardia sp. NPDC052112 TaxID=3155646 RepID=UPI00342CC8D9